MDNKFYTSLLILFLLIFLIPCVSADEIDNNTDICELSIDDVQLTAIDTQHDDVTAASEPVEVYFNASAEKDGNGSADNPYKYLRSSRLNKVSTAYFADGLYKLDTSRGIYTDIDFIGQSAENTIIKYEGMAFSVGIDTAFTATNITFLKASIRNFGVVVAENCIFKDCVAAFVDTYGNSFGGALYCKCGGFTTVYTPGAFLSNCTFINNYAQYGGAVYLELGVLSISDSNFINNSASAYGGAVACEDGTTLTVFDSYFENDESIDDAGGAIYGKTSSMVVRNSDFICCSALFGGAICTVSSTLPTQDSKTTLPNMMAELFTVCTAE